MPILKEKAPSAMLGLFYFISFQVLFIANLVYQLKEMRFRFLIRIITIILFSNVYFFSFSQITSLNWAKQLGNINAETSYCITTDKNGNVYTTGYFGSIVDFDPGPSTFTLQSAGNKDVFISKLNASGNFVWAKRIGGTTDDIGRSIAVDSVGNVYITGSFLNTVDFDPGSGTYTLTTPNSNEDVFILKLDGAGNFVWAGQQGGLFVDVCYSIAVDDKGFLYNVGSFGSTADFNPAAGTYTLTSSGADDIFISKLDTSGKFIWAKRIGSSNPDICYSLALDKFGKPYCTGYFDGTVDFDPGPAVFNMTTPFNSPNIFVLKLDTAGNFKWAKNMGGSGVETAKSICLDNYGGVYTTGYFNGAVDFDPGVSSYVINNAGSWDAFVSKLDTNGVFRWATSFSAANDQFGSSIVSDLSGNVYSVGNFTDIVDFDPGPSTFTLNGMFQNIYISKLDSAGNFIFAKQLIGGWDANSVHVDSLNAIYLAGSFSNITDFDPDPTTSYTLAAMGSYDAYVLKLGQCIIPSSPINTTTTSLTGCDPASFTLIASSTGTVNWFSSPTSTIILGVGFSYTASGLSAGNYTFYAGALTCTPSINRTPITITVNPTPTISISNGSICVGDSYALSPNGAATYTFSSGSSVVTPTVTTVYSVSGTSSLGCISSNTATATVTVNPLPVISASTSNTIICGPPFQGSATLTATGGNTYTWNPGGPGISIVVNPSVTTTYTLIGTDLNGCESSSVLTQSVSTCTGIDIQDKSNSILVYPNPNNGVFTIQIEEEFHITINDMVGRLIYSKLLSRGRYAFSELELSSGIYFLRANCNGSIQIIKLIRQ